MNDSKKDFILSVCNRPAIGRHIAPYLMAEIGTNHNRDPKIAETLIKKIALAGFSCVKFQIYEPYEIVSMPVRAADYGLSEIYGDISAREMFERFLKTPKEWFPELKEVCREHKVDFAATIHGRNGIDWANEIGLDVVKIASMDHTNIPLLSDLVNSVDVPILVSTGMAVLEDIDQVVHCLSDHKPGFGLFHCCAIYPPLPDELRLHNIPFLMDRYDIPIGFSDHSMTHEAAIVARSCGASVFEKHVTLDRTTAGPDHGFAIQNEELAEYVQAIKSAASNSSLASEGHAEYIDPYPRELVNKQAYLKSVITLRDLTEGSKIRMEDVYLARPGTGIRPVDLKRVIGKTLSRDLKKETVLQWEDLH